jgi:VIT1/CCC1 family predicted Fe2+/Mn2+ transporter
MFVVAVSFAAPGSLAFTGTQVSPVALIGLALLALGVVGAAVARRRGASVALQHA